MGCGCPQLARRIAGIQRQTGHYAASRAKPQACSTARRQMCRPIVARRSFDLRGRYGGVAVLKGSGTLVSASSGVPWLCSAGNPGMAAPGMGDVLTGIIAALLAQGLAPEDAATVGVAVHAGAGDLAAAGGERGLMASDLLGELRNAINP